MLFVEQHVGEDVPGAEGESGELRDFDDIGSIFQNKIVYKGLYQRILTYNNMMDTNVEQPVNEVKESNEQKIEYEDGKVEQKVYGNQYDTLLYRVIFHFINRSNEEVQTHLLSAESNLSLEECAILLEEKLKEPFNNSEFLDDLEKPALNRKQPLSQFFKNGEKQKQFFIFYDPVKAVIKEKPADLKYETITKYSFLDDKKKVKVYIDLEGIGSIPKENIHSRFLQRSFEVKIFDYKNKNWIFAVPKTSAMIKISESSVIVKKDKLIISIGKIADADNWSTLHRVKGVGSKDDF